MEGSPYGNKKPTEPKLAARKKEKKHHEKGQNNTLYGF